MPDPKWLEDARRDGRVLSDTGVRPAASGTPAPAPPPAPTRLVVEVTAPIKTVSEANVGRKLKDKAARKSAVKAAVAAALPRLAGPFPLPCVVTLTRRSPGKLDDDNLRAAAKCVRDSVAAWLGVDDADPRVRWRYKQRPGYACGLTIRVEHRGSP